MAAPNRPAVLLLSGYGQPSLVRAAIDRGAAGYLDKGAEMAAIVDAIRAVAGGRHGLPCGDLRAARDAPRRPSDREIEVIAHVVAGSTNAEVAAALDLSEKTVESHLHRLFDRYGLLSRTELAVLAIDEGWVPDPRGADGLSRIAQLWPRWASWSRPWCLRLCSSAIAATRSWLRRTICCRS